MHKLKLITFAAAIAFATGGATGVQAQGTDLATANMHFDANDADTNGDHMISREEFMAYGEKMWKMMSKGAETISVPDATADFARGNMRFSANAMDTDHDGSISKEEFMKYGGMKFDKVKNAKGMLSVSDATTNFATGNMATGSKPAKPAASP